MEHIFDLIVIGTGSAGSIAASQCNHAGWKVAMIDSRPFGGTCQLRGCDPKKVLVGAAEIIDWTQRMKGNGLASEGQMNWPDLMAFKRTFTDPAPEAREQKFIESGIQTFHGEAAFLSEDQVQVGSHRLKGKNIFIASGAKPTPLPIEGGEHLTYSDAFLELDQLPEKIVFIGGGYISFEFAHIAARAGSEVHILHRGERPLASFDPDLVDLLIQKSQEIGIQLHLNTEVRSIEKQGDQFIVKGTHDGTGTQWEGGLVVHGAGRTPELEHMDLEKGNVASESNGVTVNPYLQSMSNPRVYAAGDAAATEGLPLTPIANMESHAVASNLLKGNHIIPDYKVMPTVVFTIPKIASVGLTEKKALQMGYDISINKIDTSGWYTYKRTNEKYAMAKVIIDKQTKRILGAHLLSNEADELINHFATAIQFDLTTTDIKKMIYAYPTSASDLSHMLQD
ncbi:MULTISPECIES: NAD(P)/FAD-dependent oxidoreductase [unclassified Paenibacillus]|uniref:dihydrolipoyl dehydrogenase family protein n=1 Tax=unclassified Paenibacillus TaxID=185978 RepID=UPI001AE389AF|nr:MULTISPECIES: NAD(P)/FAD-dependent oxidoreductase [unclassified Paenibacillus]MBP1154884.1 glutathione reductase (NADPH) [Paenibacillus sp. PvP091]MBP1169732.1 glutathione reductase (NADPH) [Paenibacillus sp. PvR098]MBP2440760.1 glutathione reductase (NADPH) [Paenibacillus sp. PvP052]